MGIKLYILNSDRLPIAVLQHYSLDLAYGDDENDFELSFTDILPEDVTVTAGCLWYVSDSEYGGIIDTIQDNDGAVSYRGRCWHGVLANKIIEPDSGQDYYRVNGSLASIFTTLINRHKLSQLIMVDPETPNIVSGVFQFNRYITLFEGLLSLCDSLRFTVSLKWDSAHHMLLLGAQPRRIITRSTSMVTLDTTRVFRPVNHLIGLGQGELKDRATSHWYADSRGNVSQSQSLFGVDEVTAIYDYSSEDNAKLADDTRKKLAEYQGESVAKLTINNPSETLRLGDIFTARSTITGMSLTQPIGKKVVTIDEGILSVDYSLRGASETTSSH